MGKEGEGMVLDDTENERIHLLKRLIEAEGEYVMIHSKIQRIIRQLCDIEDREVLDGRTKNP